MCCKKRTFLRFNYLYWVFYSKILQEKNVKKFRVKFQSWMLRMTTIIKLGVRGCMFKVNQLAIEAKMIRLIQTICIAFCPHPPVMTIQKKIQMSSSNILFIKSSVVDWVVTIWHLQVTFSEKGTKIPSPNFKIWNL